MKVTEKHLPLVKKILKGVIESYKKVRFAKLTKDTSIVTIGMGFRAISQGLVFIIIARSMGESGYGAFVSIVAIAGMLSGLVGFGSHVLLTRDTAINNKQFHQAWGNTLISTAISIPFLFSIYLVSASLILPETISWKPIIFFGIADIIFWPLNNICVSAYQGFGRMGRTSRMILVPVLSRFMVALLFLWLTWFSEFNQLLTWSLLYLLSAFFATTYTQWKVYMDIGRPSFPSYVSIDRIKEGLPFAIWASSDKLYIDADKVMLARMTDLDVTGVYSAAHRLVDLFLLPIQSLISAATPLFFQEGGKGIRYSLSLSVQLIKIPIIYSLLVSVVIYLIADLIPFILGEGYKESVDIIRFLAWMPMIILPKIFLQSVLASTGLQKIGMLIIIAGAIVNIIINLLLIPDFSWIGAAIATYIAEISMSALMVIIIYQFSIKGGAP